MGRGANVPRRRRRKPRKILLPVHVPVPQRAPAHGARAQLHDRRRHLALPAHARQERAAAHGLGCVRPAGGGGRHQARHGTCEMDAREYRIHARSIAAPRFRLRLGSRARDLRPGLLSLGAVAVHAHALEGACLQEACSRQLGSRRPDRAGKRAGDRRLRLAFGGPGGTARDPAMVPADHGLRRGVARRPGYRGLAGEGQDHAAELDRQVARRRGAFPDRGCRRHAGHLYDPSRHADGRHLHGRRRRAPAGGRGRRRRPGVGRLPRRMRAQRRLGSGHGNDGEERAAARRQRAASDHGGGDSGLGRELRFDQLWHRCGDGRAGPRSARLGVREGARPADRAGHRACRRRRCGGYFDRRLRR